MTSSTPPPPNPSPLSLRELLAENRAHDPQYGGGLSNHLSMALGAMSALGASDERLTRFTRAYTKRLVPLRAATPLASGDFRAAIGKPAALVALSRQLETELGKRGRRALLAEVLPELWPGISGAGFHGLIRTVYALDAADDAELALGLAYYVTVAQPLRSVPRAARGAASSASELFAAVETDRELKHGFAGSLISDALLAAADQPRLDALLASLRVDADTLDQLAAAALALYLRTRDFTALHAVTSTHALRLALPFVHDPEPALRHHAQALLAAQLSRGQLEPVPPLAPAPDWPAIVAAALAADDDHAAKFVFTCREEAALRPAARYREAAALRMAL